MSQNLLYKIDKAVKQNTDTNEIAMICREYLSKFPKNIRVLKILNNIKLSQNNLCGYTLRIFSLFMLSKISNAFL